MRKRNEVQQIMKQADHETLLYLFLGTIGGATTFASAKVKNAYRQDWYILVIFFVTEKLWYI